MSPLICIVLACNHADFPTETRRVSSADTGSSSKKRESLQINELPNQLYLDPSKISDPYSPIAPTGRRVALVIGGGERVLDGIFEGTAKAINRLSTSFETHVLFSGPSKTWGDHRINLANLITSSIKVEEFSAEKLLGTPDSSGILPELVQSLNSGDQFLILITTHGIKRKQGEKTHSVLLAVPENDELSLDRLEPWLQQAEQKGASVAVVDTSCYSGATLALNIEGCLISSSLWDETGTMDFIVAMWSELSDSNLENLFLQGRAKVENWNAIPAISTPEGKYIQILQNQFENFLRESDEVNYRKYVASTCSFQCGELAAEKVLSVIYPWPIEEDLKRSLRKSLVSYFDKVIEEKQRGSLFIGARYWRYDIYKSEQEIYFALYKRMSEIRTQSNPCREFKI